MTYKVGDYLGSRGVNGILLPYSEIDWNENGFSDTVDDVVTFLELKSLALL